MTTKSQPTIFFVHQNIPGQFRNLVPALVAAGYRVYFITNAPREMPGAVTVHYGIDADIATQAPEQAMFKYAQRAAKAMVMLGRAPHSVRPDVIVGHVSWGELLFVRDLYPDVPILGYFEWFQSTGLFSDFDPSYEAGPDAPFVLRLKNIPNYVLGDTCTAGLTPTWFQHSGFPKAIQDKLTVIHDGVDTLTIRRPVRASLTLPDGRVLTQGDEVVTYVGRGLEPVRGFPTAIRAIGELCRMRPNCHFIIIGADKTSYGNPLPEGESYRQRLLAEVAIDESRVHFLGHVPYETFLKVLYISSAHIYLTYPFFLSWSMLEAMAAECLVIGSRTAPVEEVIVDGHNGLLVDFFDAPALAERVRAVLERPRDYDPLRMQARHTIHERYDLHGICLPRQKALIASLL